MHIDSIWGFAQRTKSCPQKSDWNFGQIQDKAMFCLPRPSKCTTVGFSTKLFSIARAIPSACSPQVPEVEGK